MRPSVLLASGKPGLTEVDMTADDLEKLVDDIGLDGVVSFLETICFEKADHLRANWGDLSGAKLWEHSAKTLGKVCSNLHCG